MRISIGLAAAAAIGCTSTALAQTLDATDPAKLVSVIRELGYHATLDRDDVGDPMIRSNANGTNFTIQFYGCDAGAACKWLLFRVGYDLAEGTTLAAMNDWNAKALFGRAYLDDEHDPWLEMMVTLDGGVTRENFADIVDWWDVSVVQFEEHIGF